MFRTFFYIFPGMDSEPVIEIRQVYKTFKAVRAVDGVDLAVYRGQFVALLGPNGAGKTTLVEMIEGDSGEVRQITLDTELIVRGSCRRLEKN